LSFVVVVLVVVLIEEEVQEQEYKGGEKGNRGEGGRREKVNMHYVTIVTDLAEGLTMSCKLFRR